MQEERHGVSLGNVHEKKHVSVDDATRRFRVIVALGNVINDASAWRFEFVNRRGGVHADVHQCAYSCIHSKV